MVWLAACSDPSSSQDVLLSADPPSLVRGQTVSVTLTAPESLFDRDLEAPLTTAGGLVLRSLRRSSDTEALAEIVSTEATEVGRHEFGLEMGRGVGRVSLSVLPGPLNPGQIFAANAEASSGADWATLYIDGLGTSWDSGVQVSAEGAPGFHVLAWRVVTESRLEVSYSIDLDQAPTLATILIQDGAAQWQVPFTIVAASSFENLAGPQAVVKGRVSAVGLRNPSAGISQWTTLVTDQEDVELGEAEELSPGSVELPVRVPFDFAGQELTLLAKTFSPDHRYVELMPVDVVLHEPGAAVFSPSRVALDQETQQGALLAEGIDLLGFEGLNLPQETGLAVQKTSVESEHRATVDWLVSSVAQDGFVSGTLTVNGVDWPVIVAVTANEIWDAAAATQTLQAGDRVQLPIMTTGLNLEAASFTLEPASTLAVQSFEVKDPGCLVLDLQVDRTAWAGEHTIWIRNDVFDLRVSISVEEGPFDAI